MRFKRKATALLEEWKNQTNGSYAALLEGARRVGKSTIAEDFAKSHYTSYIKVDFAEADSDLLDVFNSITRLDEFFLRLQNITGKVLYPRKSVIIFDEIQLQPKVRQAIKYLVKDGRYDYIETGSLLTIKKNVKGIVIPSEEWKIPVFPMDYEEFLWATGLGNYDLLHNSFESGISLGQSINRSLMRSFRTYTAVGGMPQAVEAFVDKKPFKAIDRVKRRIIDLYEDDFFKIDPTGRISFLFESIPAQLARNAKRFSISFALDKKARAKDHELLSDLVNSRTVMQCFNCNDPRVSFSMSKDIESFKLYMADTGLFVSLLLKTGEYTEEQLYAKLLSDKLPANLGYLYENAVAQAFSSRGEDLYYCSWQKPNSTHSFEVDFLLRKGIKTIPVEVKCSRTKPHDSLDAFIERFSSIAINPCILSQKDLGKTGQIERI